MLSSRLAVVGETATVVAFEGLGISAYPVESAEEAREAVARLIRAKEHAVIFVTEDIGPAVSDLITEASREYVPSVVLVPSSAGSQKIGLRRLSQVLKRALGADILKVE